MRAARAFSGLARNPSFAPLLELPPTREPPTSWRGRSARCGTDRGAADVRWSEVTRDARTTALEGSPHSHRARARRIGVRRLLVDGLVRTARRIDRGLGRRAPDY